MDKLQIILDKLSDRGMYLFGQKLDKIQAVEDKITGKKIIVINCCAYSLNDLCSIESGFWQFVVENCIYSKTEGKTEGKTTIYFPSHISYVDEFTINLTKDNPNYRIMNSSIKDDKAEFIVENILFNDETHEQ